ncbi:MAG: hypothetical protein ACI84K_001970 [Pseudohongiellaceae bacterium]|jgi:hypothetical protein
MKIHSKTKLLSATLFSGKLLILKILACYAIIIFGLISCSKTTFEGTYTAAGGMQKFHFKTSGDVAQSLAGNKVAEYNFEKKGDEIKIYMNENAAQVFTLQEDGTLIGPGGITLRPID